MVKFAFHIPGNWRILVLLVGAELEVSLPDLAPSAIGGVFVTGSSGFSPGLGTPAISVSKAPVKQSLPGQEDHLSLILMECTTQ